MKIVEVLTDFSALSLFHDISYRLGTRSLLQLLRGQPIQQEWLDDYVFKATPCEGRIWPDYYDFGGGLLLVSHKFRSFLESFCHCTSPPYQFLKLTWEAGDEAVLSEGYSLLNVLDMRGDALLFHDSRVGINRHGQFDARSKTVIDYSAVSGCDHLIRLEAWLIVAVDQLALRLSESDLTGFKLKDLSLGGADVASDQSDEPKSH